MKKSEAPKSFKKSSIPKTSEELHDEIRSEILSSSRGHVEDLVDHYWGSINYVFSLIKASELKAGLILSFYGILFNIIYTHIGIVLTKATEYPALYGLLGLWGFATIASIYYSVRCFMPRIEGKYEKNMFFFGDVITKYGSIKEFSKTFYQISLNEEGLFDQLGQQIYINSKIAAGKFKNVNKAIIFLAAGLAMLFIITVYYIIIVL